MTCIQIIDPETREARQSTREDLASITRVADALPDIDGACVTPSSQLAPSAVFDSIASGISGR